MQHFAEDDYSVEKAIARYEGLPFLPKVADSGLQVGRADLDPYTPEDQHWLPIEEEKLETPTAPMPAAAPTPPEDPNCPYCYGEGCENCSPEIYEYQNRFESKKKCQCWDGYKRVPGTKPCAPGSCEKCDSGSKKESSQGDKPSPKAAKAVFDALASGDEETAKELLKQTDCPEGCETHPEGKCNHGYMAAGRTRVRFLVSSEPFSKEDKYTGPVE